MTTKLYGEDLFTLLSCSIRYALGRSSYIVSDVSRVVRQNSDSLTKDQKQNLSKDIWSALERCRKNDTTLGMDIDHKEWVNLLNHLGGWAE